MTYGRKAAAGLLADKFVQVCFCPPLARVFVVGAVASVVMVVSSVLCVGAVVGVGVVVVGGVVAVVAVAVVAVFWC